MTRMQIQSAGRIDGVHYWALSHREMDVRESHIGCASFMSAVFNE